ncbi:hypothetical protein MATL_G00098860 [Megalops atlanticus]|uniref:Uncharacterized protein n=1 Tax=Megalops atlanticus TaxID=7932 RepID=A0A9D3Q606_MEGAT|nr:hypothetical protein MATL_G00098860 [Megalops atlanticus]
MSKTHYHLIPARTSTSGRRGPRTRSVRPGDQAAPWAPARCTTWRTASTSSTTSSRSAVPPWTKSARWGMAGGVAHSLTAMPLYDWRAAGCGPCGGPQTAGCTDWRCSSGGHEAGGGEEGGHPGTLWPRFFGQCQNATGASDSRPRRSNVLQFTGELHLLAAPTQSTRWSMVRSHRGRGTLYQRTRWGMERAAVCTEEWLMGHACMGNLHPSPGHWDLTRFSVSPSSEGIST